MKQSTFSRRVGFTCLFLFILTTAISITINSVWVYRISIQQYDILSMTDLSKKNLLANYSQLLAYLNFPWVKALALPDFPMSDSGMMHFVDVKQLFFVNYLVWLVTVIPTFLFLRAMSKERAYWRMVRPFQLASVIPIVFGCLMALGFDRFFITFHEVFFRNSDWQFDPVTDPIINVLPEGFFMNCFLLFFVLIEGCLIIGYFISKYLMKQEMKKIDSL